MALNITGNFTFEEDWLQQDCHWNLNRYFAIRWSVDDPNVDLPSFSYKIKKNDGNEKDIYPTFADSEQKNNAMVFYRQISLDSIINDLSNAAKLVAVLTINGIKNELSYNLTNFVPALPPATPEALSISLVTTNPGEVRCSWSQPDEINDVNEARGYCIEIFHNPEGEVAFTQLNNLGWNEYELNRGKYYIEKISKEEIVIPDVEGEFTTFIFNKPNSELYIEDPTIKEFYFMPKQLGVKPGDRYIFRIHPYNVYGTYWTYDEDGNLELPKPGTLLTNEGSSMEGKVSKGIVRVKTDNGWVEGQVWVYAQTADGLKWVQAEAVYAMADDGTGKGIWKEAQ